VGMTTDMPARRITILVEDRLLEEVDRLACVQRTTRSGLISQLLLREIRETHDLAVTDALDAVFVAPGARTEQLKLTREKYPREIFGD
jgi:hypothetical protein